MIATPPDDASAAPVLIVDEPEFPALMPVPTDNIPDSFEAEAENIFTAPLWPPEPLDKRVSPPFPFKLEPPWTDTAPPTEDNELPPFITTDPEISALAPVFKSRLLLETASPVAIEIDPEISADQADDKETAPEFRPLPE
jgi:hypothetical protein